MAVSTIDALYNGGSEKISATSTGVDVTGTLTSDGLTVDGNILDNAGFKVKGYYANAVGDGYNVNLGVSGNIGYLQSLNGTSLNPLSLDGSTFSVRTGAYSTALTVDSSGNVGIGTSSPNSYTANGNNLVVADVNVGVTLASTSTTGSGALYFADGTSGSQTYRGIINYLHSSDAMGFFTGSSERMRIDSSGDLLVGTASTLGTNEARLEVFNGGGARIIQTKTDSNSNTNHLTFNTASGQAGYIYTNTLSTSYVTSSDYRLKENVVELTGAADRLKQIPVHRFNFIANPDTTVDGFLAHEAQAVVPESVHGTQDAMRDEEYEVTPAVLDDDGNETTAAVMGTRSVPDYQGIDQSKLVPLLTAALQEALTKIDDMETRLAALEG